jgi:monoamine oxidase
MLSRLRLPPLPPQAQQARVVIVGAGAAGLVAAHLLQNAGVQVEVIEANAQPGGRVRRSASGWEQGACHLRGITNLLAREAIERGVVQQVLGLRPMVILDGRLHDLTAPGLDADIAALMAQIARIPSYRGGAQPLSAWLARRKLPPRVQPLAGRLAELVGGTAETVCIAELARLYPALPFLYGPAGDHADHDVTEPFVSLLDGLVLPLRGALHTGAAVTAIHHGGRGPLRVDTATGRSWTADKVLVTVPLPILKQRRIQFFPALPWAKLQAIDRLQVVPGLKGRLTFSAAFWPSPFRLIGAETVARCWTERSAPALQFEALGHQAEALACLRPEEAAHRVLAELDPLFDGEPSKRFVEAELLDWTAEPWIGGAYTLPAAGWTADKARLAQPIHGRLFFAGDATNTGAPFEHTPHTVQGALATGLRAATEIATALRHPER